MPTVDERLKQVTLKIERAKKHIVDLERELRAFLDSNPYKVGTKRDPQSRKLIYYLTHVEPTPEDPIALISGDAVQNLMSALDHLAYQLVCSDTNDTPPNRRWIYFPIRSSAEEYEAVKKRKMEGAATETFAAIDVLEPYKGGNDNLWALYQLNNIEKHRLLITVGSMLHSLDLGAHTSKMLADMIAGSSLPYRDHEIPVMHAFFSPANASDRLFPLKTGDQIFTDGPDAEPNPHMQFRFSVALHEPEVIEAQSLLETLHQLTTLVEGIVTALAHRLKG